MYTGPLWDSYGDVGSGSIHPLTLSDYIEKLSTQDLLGNEQVKRPYYHNSSPQFEALNRQLSNKAFSIIHHLIL